MIIIDQAPHCNVIAQDYFAIQPHLRLSMSAAVQIPQRIADICA
ncbi:hypothetical protein D8I24_3084 (plasmid) [Cupriavidus necator H850]|nr:hypothetical protein D8I24_3084 [Cupriavidus necator H850]